VDRYLVRNIFHDFADASTAKMKQESVTELTAHYRVGLTGFSFFL